MQASGSPPAPPAAPGPGGRQRDRVALPPGARLGELEILRVLAVGGFGIVYLARDHSLDRDVAVKEFMPGQLVGRGRGHRVTVRSPAHAELFAAGLRSFVDEAKLLARFSHPAMVKVYRIREANGTAYMVMPYLHGPTLSDVRSSMSEPPTEVWLRRVVDPLLDALAMLHDAGIYHRDISPENVLMTGGAPVLLDFGAARQLIGDRTRSLTAILKPRYAPIEQYAEATQLRQGPWTDLYALAALLRYLLDGEPPPASTARAIHDDMEPLAGRRISGVSAALLSAIDWALAVRPQDRPQSVAEFRRALGGPPVSTATSMRPPGAPVRAGAAPATPFTTTVQLDRPDAGRAAGGRSAWSLSRIVTQRWRAALGGVLVAVAVGWAVSRQPEAPPGGAEPSAAATTLASAERPEPAAPPIAPDAGSAPVQVVATAPIGTAAAGPAASSNAGTAVSTAAAGAPMAADAPAVLGAATAGLVAALPGAVPPVPATRRLAGHAPRAAERAKTLSRADSGARIGRLAAASSRSPGPVEMCAGHNFLVRPFCVRRQCDEPRFWHDAYCRQLRQVAQYRRDQLP